MKGLKSTIKTIASAAVVNAMVSAPAIAEEVVAASAGASEILSTRSCAALAIGLAVFGATNAQAKAISAALDSIGRNPGAAGAMFLPWLLALVFIESLVLFVLVIAFQII